MTSPSNRDDTAAEVSEKVKRRGPTFKKDIIRKRSKGEPKIKVRY